MGNDVLSALQKIAVCLLFVNSIYNDINLPFDPGIHPLVTDSAFGAPTIEDISSIDAFC